MNGFLYTTPHMVDMQNVLFDLLFRMVLWITSEFRAARFHTRVTAVMIELE